MREMAFIPHQDYMSPFPTQHQHHHDFIDDTQHHHHHHHPSSVDPNHSISLNAALSSCPPPHDFPGGPVIPSLSMMNRSMSFSGYQQHYNRDHDNLDHDQGEPVTHHDHHHLSDDPDHHHDQGAGGGGGDHDAELSDDGSQVVLGGPGSGEKKKRLNMEQVKTLEKTFEQGNKLEPERKIQLAKALGLQPRQVAIWFQNRRARWKSKQLEKDYAVLKRQFDALKTDNDSLHAQNKKLHAELISLRGREGTDYGAINLNNADTKSFWSNNGSEISSDMNLGTSRTPQTGSPLSPNPSIKLQFPPNPFISTGGMTQLLQSSTQKPPGDLDLRCTKIDPASIQDETFCNVFGPGGGQPSGGGGGGGDSGMDQNHPPSFWAWPQQQHLN